MAAPQGFEPQLN